MLSSQLWLDGLLPPGESLRQQARMLAYASGEITRLQAKCIQQGGFLRRRLWLGSGWDRVTLPAEILCGGLRPFRSRLV